MKEKLKERKRQLDRAIAGNGDKGEGETQAEDGQILGCATAQKYVKNHIIFHRKGGEMIAKEPWKPLNLPGLWNPCK